MKMNFLRFAFQATYGIFAQTPRIGGERAATSVRIFHGDMGHCLHGATLILMSEDTCGMRSVGGSLRVYVAWQV